MSIFSTHKTAYAVTLIILISFNITAYSYFVYLQQQKDKLLLAGYLDSIGNLLLQDLKVATNGAIRNKNFSLFRRFSATTEGVKADLVRTAQSYNLKITPYAIYIKSSTGELILDLQGLRETLNKIFPLFLDYGIAINSHNITTWRADERHPDIVKDYTVDLNTVFTIRVGISPESNLYLLNRQKLYNSTLIAIIVSCLSGLLLLHLYLKSNIRAKETHEALEEELCEEKRANKALLSNKKVRQQLNRLFIKKATEMYVKQELGGVSEENFTLRNIPPNNYLFPMCLYDPSSEKINIEDLVKALEEYFSPYSTTTALRVKTTTDTVNINCTTEVFYQLIFSIIFNLIEFMDRQSEIPKAISVNFSEQKVIINYDSFPLDEERMVSLSDSVILEYTDIFLLNVPIGDIKSLAFEAKGR